MYLSTKPESILEFKLSSDCVATATMTLKNISGIKIAFKIKCSAPMHFNWRPNNGIIAPNESRDIEITIQSLKDFPQEVIHKFLVQSVPDQHGGLTWDKCTENKFTVNVPDISELQATSESKRQKSESTNIEIYDKQESVEKTIKGDSCIILEKSRLLKSNVEHSLKCFYCENTPRYYCSCNTPNINFCKSHQETHESSIGEHESPSLNSISTP